MTAVYQLVELGSGFWSDHRAILPLFPIGASLAFDFPFSGVCFCCFNHDLVELSDFLILGGDVLRYMVDLHAGDSLAVHGLARSSPAGL